MRSSIPKSPMKVPRKAKRGNIYLERYRGWVIIICPVLFLGCVLVFTLDGLQPTSVSVVKELFGVGNFFRSTASVSSHKTHRPTDWHNLLVKESSTYRSTLIETMRANANSTSPCYSDMTNFTILEGLPKPVQGKYIFQTDKLHRLTLVAYGMNREKRCFGGDYYEVDFHDCENVHYRARLPTVDFNNGSYGLDLIVPSRFAGSFIVEIWMLYSNWHGMDSLPGPWVKQTLMVAQELEMVVDTDELLLQQQFDLESGVSQNSDLKQCTQTDFNRTTWQGRWTRSWFNDSCAPDHELRFRCLPEEHFRCEEPWCFGPVGRLDSNGWEYSAHCSFKIFQREEAWECLKGRWFLMWGDSNFQDTVRNLLLFILDWEMPPGENLADFQLERSYENEFVNPREPDQVFRVSQLFNGANEMHGNGEGLKTLMHEEHQQALLAHFNDAKCPDTVIMNSGLHDGISGQWDSTSAPDEESAKLQALKSTETYAGLADFAVDWWVKLYNIIPADRKPQIIWRTTVAPAGSARSYTANPNKMEMYNQVMVEKLKHVGDKLPVKFVDAFDLTFPFHYSHEYSDGGHYGRAPGVNLPPWHRGVHWYFVDIMVAHIFLNAACPPT